MDFSEDRLNAESHGRRCAAERHDVELDAREDEVHARRDPRADRAQRLGCDVVVVEDAARDATPPSSSDGSTPRSIGPECAEAAASMSDIDSAPCFIRSGDRPWKW